MEAFDPDDERPGSPFLEKQEIKYRSSETPPPFLPEKSSSSFPDDTPHPVPGQRSNGVKKKRRPQTQPTQGDSVLMSYLDGNRPDIAREAGVRASLSGSQSEAEGSDDEGTSDRPDTPPNNVTKLAQDALDHIHQPLENSEQPVPSHPNGIDSAKSNGVANAILKKDRLRPIDAKDTDEAVGLERLSESSQKSRRTTRKIRTSIDGDSGEDSLVMSPNLRKNMISASEGSLMQTLPAIQGSPPASASALSLEGAQKLPSIHTALAGADSSMMSTQVSQNFSTSTAAPSIPSLSAQFSLLKPQLLDPTNASTQILAVPAGGDVTAPAQSTLLNHTHAGSYFTIMSCLTRPFSRGSIHIQEPTTDVPPLIHPAYLSHPMDLDIMAHPALHASKIATTEPLASKLKNKGTVPFPTSPSLPPWTKQRST